MVKWELDRQAATICGEFGDWKQRIVTQGEIDEKASRQNFARRESLDSQLVDEYAASMRDGATFPCIVCVQIDGADRLVIAGGNHRHAAARKLKDGEFLAIVMTLPQADFMLLAKRLNVVNGKREDVRARAEAAADLVLLHGRSISDAAKAMNMSHSMVHYVMASRALEELCIKMGRPVLSTPATVAGAAQVLFSDADLASLCLDFLSLKPSAKDVSQVAANIRRAKSLADRQAMLTAAIQSRRGSMKTVGGAKKPVKAAIHRSITMLENTFNRGDSLCYLQMSAAEAMELLNKLDALDSKLRDIIASGSTDT